MRRTVAVMLALLLPLAGCAARNYMKRGDASLRAGEGVRALEYYQKALAADPELGEKQEFAARLADAGRLAAYQQGKQFAEAGNYEAAIAKFEESLQIDRHFTPAAEALARARYDGSRAYHRKALQLADQGQFNAAVEQLRRALVLDGENLDAREALDSTQQIVGPSLSGAQQRYDAAMQLESQKRLAEAESSLAEAIRHSGNHIPARVALHRVRQSLAAARQAGQRGAQLLAQKRLDAAIDSLTAALDIWPFYPEAGAAMEQARAQRARAQERFEQAQALAARSQWDAAIAAYAETLEAYPYHAAAEAALEETRRRAAQELTDAGDAQLAAGQFVSAEALYRRAMTYQPAFAAARQGMGRASAARGDAAAGAGQWGLALLWYANAEEHFPDRAWHDKAAHARAMAAQRIGFSLAVQSGGGDAHYARLLTADLVPTLQASGPAFVTLAAAPAQADYVATVAVSEHSIRESLVGSQTQAYLFYVDQEVPNPDVPILQRQVVDIERHVIDLRRELRRARDELARHERRRPRRPPAEEFPEHPRDDRRDGDRPRTDGPRQTWPEMERWTRDRDRLRRRVDALEAELRDAEFALQRARHDLQFAPPSVIHTTQATWPYTVNTYEKIGRMRAAVQLLRGGQVADSFTLEAATRDADATIANPNPAIGLGEDPLVLPADAQIDAELLDSLVSQTAGRVLGAALAARSAALGAIGDTLAESGKTGQAVEVYVDAALTLEPADPNAAASRLYELRKALAAAETQR